MTHFIPGNIVKLVKKVTYRENPNWSCNWDYRLDALIGMNCLVTNVNWFNPEGSESYYGMGVTISDPTNYQRAFNVHPSSIKLANEARTLIYDKEGPEGIAVYQHSAPLGSYGFRTREGLSFHLILDPHCCGVAYFGSFSIDDRKPSELALQKAIAMVKEFRKGVIKSTVINQQPKVIAVLEKAGFTKKSSFRNPNSNNIVHEYEHRTFNGAVDV